MFWKSKKKEGDWNTAYKNLKPLKKSEEAQRHQEEYDQGDSYDQDVIDEYESYLSNHSLSKKFIVCLDNESMGERFKRGFDFGLKKDIITQERRDEYNSLSKTVGRDVDSVVNTLFPESIFAREGSRFFEFFENSIYAGAFCIDFELDENELEDKVRAQVFKQDFDYDKPSIKIFSFDKDGEIAEWLKYDFDFSKYRFGYKYAWKKQKEWNDLYREYWESTRNDEGNFHRLGLRLDRISYRDPEENILQVDWEHSMDVFGYHKTYWFSENHPYPEEMEVGLLAIANYFSYQSVFYLDYDGLVKIANGDLIEYRNSILPVLNDMDRRADQNPLYQADHVIKKIREFLFGTRNFKENTAASD